MAYDKKSKEYIDTYRKTQSFLQIRVTPAEKNTITQHARECGESVNAFVARAIKEAIKKDIRRKKSQQSRDQQFTKKETEKLDNT